MPWNAGTGSGLPKGKQGAMTTGSYSVLEEEIISTNFQRILHTLKIYHWISERIGLEMALKNGRMCGANLNFYKTRQDALGNVNCIVQTLTDNDREYVKVHVIEILRILRVQVPTNVSGQVELIAEYNPVNRMRIQSLLLSLRTSFTLEGHERSDPKPIPSNRS